MIKLLRVCYSFSGLSQLMTFIMKLDPRDREFRVQGSLTCLKERGRCFHSLFWYRDLFWLKFIHEEINTSAEFELRFLAVYM